LSERKAKTIILVGLLALLAFTIQGCSGADQQTPPPLSAQQLAMQKERLAFIQKMVDQGVFQKMEKSELWVTPRFYGLDFDTKSKIIGVAYAYYITENPRSKIIHLVDNRTGKLIGKFSENAGGLALD
jgi:hypothetical protein